MKATEILEIVSEAAEFMPIVRAMVPLVMEAGGEIKPVMESLIDGLVDLQVRAFDRYVKAGMTRGEALTMCVSTKVAFEQLNNSKKS